MRRRWTAGCGVHGLAACISLAAALLSAQAGAHGGIPRVRGVQFPRADNQHLFLTSYEWGAFRTEDGGRTWSWTCAEMYGGQTVNGRRVPVLQLASGELLGAGKEDGLVRVAADGCSSRTVTAFDLKFVPDLIRRNADSTLLLAHNDEDADAHLWRSTDEGIAWTTVTTLSATDVSTLGVSESDPDRLYAAGFGSSGSAVFHRSLDGGGTWTASDLPISGFDSTPRIAAVHPSDPDQLWLWADAPGSPPDVEPDSLWYSEDGGDTWRRLYQGVGDLPGFALSPDGDVFVLAGPGDGLWTAPTDAPESLVSLETRSFWGLAWTPNGLFAGTDMFDEFDDAPALGVSTNDGRDFSTRMSICNVRALSCPTESQYVTTCVPLFYDVDGSFREDFQRTQQCADPQRDPVDAAVPADAKVDPPGDAGRPDASARDAGPPIRSLSVFNDGCALPSPGGIGGRQARPAWPVLLAALGLAVGALRSRRGRA